MATVPVSHLSFVDDAMPGITRRRFGRAWGYFSARGGRITDRAEIDRQPQPGGSESIIVIESVCHGAA